LSTYSKTAFFYIFSVVVVKVVKIVEIECFAELQKQLKERVIAEVEKLKIPSVFLLEHKS
jgi:hypothetical protein